MKTIQANGYPVHIGLKVFTELNRLLRQSQFTRSKIIILLDDASLRFCYPELVKHVPRARKAEIIEINHGEEFKNIDTCKNIWSTLSSLGVTRNSVLINLGGGVIGDMGGFVAATFKRGIKFIQIPTTLLAQVDASIGGKLGIDLNNLKNEVGAFANPLAVFVFPHFLVSLPPRQYLSGYAEIIKHALIADKKFWKHILSEGIQPPTSQMENVIAHSIEIKNKIVKKDPHEKGLRKILNFGHTIGHAIESLALESGSFSVLHGEAVAAGMVCEAFLSAQKAGLPKNDLNEITSFLLETYKHINLNKFDEFRLIELMRHDKKNTSGHINFSLLKAIGVAREDYKCDVPLIRQALNYYRLETKFKNA